MSNTGSTTDILGHSWPNFTMRQYAHSFEEVRERAIVDVGVLLKNNARVLERAEKKTRDEVGAEEPPKDS